MSPLAVVPSSPLSGRELAKLVREGLFLGADDCYSMAEGPGCTLFLRHGVELGPDVPSVCSIGAFDGVHVGHRKLASEALEDAARRSVPCVAVTFDPDPADILVGPRESMRLLETRDRVRALASLGFDAVVAFRFDGDLAKTPYSDFVTSRLSRLVRPVSLHVGTNFRLGHRGLGNVAALSALGETLGFDVFGHDLVEVDGRSVSATRVRALLHEGDVSAATRLLGRLHFVRGVVSHGRGEGTSFGFPTANLLVDKATCMPAEGVYACLAYSGGTAWPAAVNVGAPPSFSDPNPHFLEANLIGFEGDLYGLEMVILFVSWLRASRTF
ncbi:MAG: hypothetical protein J6D54_09465, partial [Olsenella sp.]|nr:hypothetical protein [Olsenella sp.]